MRILYFLAHPNDIGGAAMVLIKHAYIAQNLKHSVKLILQQNANGNYINEYDEILSDYGIEYASARFTVVTQMEDIDLAHAIKDYDEIKAIILQYRPDIIHSIQLNTTVEMVSRELDIPHIMSIYPVATSTFNICWANYYPHYQCGDSLYFCSRWGIGLGIESRRISIPYETKSLSRKQREDSLIKAICVATFTPYKNQLEIIKSIERCLSEGVKIDATFLGDCSGGYGDACKDYIDKHELKEMVHILGRVNNVEKYYTSADVLLHASEIESFPGVIIEAMANKVLVITTTPGGVSEKIKDLNNGIVIDGYGSNSIYSALMKYAQLSENKVKDILDEAYRTYCEHNTYVAVGDALVNYYKAICADFKRNIVNRRNYPRISDAMQLVDGVLGKHTVSKYTLEHAYYLYHLKNLIKNKEEVYIWGCGNNSAIAWEWCELIGVKVSGFIDQKSIATHHGCNVFRPNREVISNAKVIIVAVQKYNMVEDIVMILESYGKVRNRDYVLLFNDFFLVDIEK